MRLLYKFSVLLIIVSFLFVGKAFSQWLQQPGGTDEWLFSVCFLDEFNGWVVGNGGTILRTTNGGNNWISQSIDTNLVLFDVCFIDDYNGFIVGENGTILRTTDSGSNWVFQNSGTFWALAAVSFSDAANGTAVGAEGTIVRTTNGGYTWESQTSNTYYPLNDVCFKDPSHGVIVGGSRTILRTIDGGQNWIDESLPWSFSDQLLKAPPDLTSMSFIDLNTGYAVGYYNTILKTTDGGDNWTYLSVGYGPFLEGVSFPDENTGTVVCSSGIIKRTTDGGLTWEIQQSGTYAWLDKVCFSDPIHGTIVGESGLILRTDNGGIPVELVSFTAECVDGSAVLNWMTSTETNNRGFDIERKSVPECNPSCNQPVSQSVNQSFNWEKIGFVEGAGTSTKSGLYSFTDKDLPSGIYSYRLKQIDFDGSANYSREAVVEVSGPEEFMLYQNYPNPFNPSTKIKWYSHAAGWQTLKIFDILGKEIASLVNEYKTEGRYEYEFDGGQYPSGVYFCLLTAGKFTAVKKLVLLK